MGKAVDEMNPVWEAQILSHLKLTNKHIGFLINFNVPIHYRTLFKDRRTDQVEHQVLDVFYLKNNQPCENPIGIN